MVGTPLEDVYAVVFMGAIHYLVRNEGRIVKKAVYIAIGIDMDGHRDVVGLCAFAISTILYTIALALAPPTELLNSQFFRLTANGRIKLDVIILLSFRNDINKVPADIWIQ